MARQDRGTARGAAMIESLIVISVMILFFLGMVFFHSMYGQKLRAISLARSATVAHAINACNDDPTAYIQAELNGATQTSIPQPGGSYDFTGNKPPQLGLSGSSPVPGFLANSNFTNEIQTEMDITTHAGVQAQDNMTPMGFQASPSTASFALCGDRERDGTKEYPNVVAQVSIHDAFPF
jgi:hypothetical protein